MSQLAAAPAPPPPAMVGRHQNGQVPNGSSLQPSPPQSMSSESQQQHQVAGPNSQQPLTPYQQLQLVTADAWIMVGTYAESLEETEKAIDAYEAALKYSPYSIQAMTALANLYRSRENFSKAIDYYQKILSYAPDSGATWGSLGHCYLMMDDLQKAYQAYQQALYNLRNPKDPKLWYGIGILYDRYGSLEYAEEAFSQVMDMDPNFEKANEIYFRLGIIYKQQGKYQQSFDCFRYILHNPPKPLTSIDIWFQIGHVHEQKGEFDAALEAYQTVLKENPVHAKVLQQLGWLYHEQSSAFENQDRAIGYLTKSLEADPQDAQSWYLLGRCYMSLQKYNKAYESYQQAVYRDASNPNFWCSIGVLYYQINQHRDALDAYSRAIRINPYISEVWYDLGTLYESCNNQISDALDAYQRAADLDPHNTHIQARLEQLRANQNGNGHPMIPPKPQDVNPHSYQQGPPSSAIWNHPHQESRPVEVQGPVALQQIQGSQAPPPLLQQQGLQRPAAQLPVAQSYVQPQQMPTNHPQALPLPKNGTAATQPNQPVQPLIPVSQGPHGQAVMLQHYSHQNLPSPNLSNGKPVNGVAIPPINHTAPAVSGSASTSIENTAPTTMPPITSAAISTPTTPSSATPGAPAAVSVTPIPEESKEIKPETDDNALKRSIDEESRQNSGSASKKPAVNGNGSASVESRKETDAVEAPQRNVEEDSDYDAEDDTGNVKDKDNEEGKEDTKED